MREISARFVGSMVLACGAIAALAAGVMLPVLGGWGAGTTAVDSGGGLTVSDTSEGAPVGARGTRAGPSSPPSPRGRTGQIMALQRPVLRGAVAAAASIPASADMVLVVENAADLRQSAIGAAAVRFLLDGSSGEGVTQTRLAWTALATQVGWSEEELFDRLLGRRVVLIARGIGDAQTARWALLSDVSIETDQHLKTRLEASPRAIDKGHQILSIEKGKYELTSHRMAVSPREARRRIEPAEDYVTLVLGPGGRTEMFDEMVGVLAAGPDGAADPLAGRPVIFAAAKSGEPEILLISSLGSGPDAAGSESGSPARDRWSDYFVLAGGRPAPARAADDPATGGAEFVSRVIYRDGRQRQANLAIPQSSDGAFRALEPGSLLTIVQAAPVAQVLGERAKLLDVFLDLPVPDSARPLLSQRPVISLREVRAPGAPADAPTRLAGVLAMESTSTTDLAPIIDGAIARYVGAQEQRFGVQRPPPHDFGGRLPGITRVLHLDVPDGNPLRMFVSDPLSLAWSFPRARDARGAGGAGQPDPAAAGGGWWVLSIAPWPPGLESLPEYVHNSVVESLSRMGRAPGGAAADGPGETRRWIWLGSMRPAALESRLPSAAMLPDIGGFRAALRRFDHVTVRLSIGDDGEIEGEFSARLPGSP